MRLNLIVPPLCLGLLISVLAFAVATGVNAQQKRPYLDSLDKHPKEDIVRLNLLLRLATANQEKPADPYADMAIALKN